MASTEYTYALSEFANDIVDVDRLTSEIQASAIVTALDFINLGSDCRVWFKDALSAGDKTVLDGIVAAHTGEEILDIQTVTLNSQKDSKNRPFFIPWVTEGSRTTKISHRWNDPTTWIGQASGETETACSALVAGTSYSMPRSNIIDVYHGKLWEEEQKPEYRVLVEVDEGSGWEAKTEVDPHDGVGDYTVDYAAGTVTFSPSIDVGASVRASYYYANGSQYILAPAPGKTLLIKSAEVQFSQDVELQDTVIFETFGYVDVFAPQLMPGVPSGTKIPLKKTVYKTLHQFIDESNGSYPQIPAIGGSGWRGIQSPITVFPWNYAAALPLSSVAGMEVRIYCEHDVPFLGSYATATFYCLSEDET